MNLFPRTGFRRDTSEFLFAMAVTLLLCGFAAGIIWIDRSVSATVRSADGLLYPAEEALLRFVEKYL